MLCGLATSQINPLPNLHKLTSKGYVALIHQLLNTATKIRAHDLEPLCPVTPESIADPEKIRFCNIWISFHKLFQFIAAQRIEKHHLLEICREPRIWNYQLWQKCMGTPTFLALHPKNPEFDCSEGRFHDSWVISMADQATGMTATTGNGVQVQIFNCTVIIFCRDHLVILRESCYHSDASGVAPLGTTRLFGEAGINC